MVIIYRILIIQCTLLSLLIFTNSLPLLKVSVPNRFFYKPIKVILKVNILTYQQRILHKRYEGMFCIHLFLYYLFLNTLLDHFFFFSFRLLLFATCNLLDVDFTDQVSFEYRDSISPNFEYKNTEIDGISHFHDFGQDIFLQSTRMNYQMS